MYLTPSIKGLPAPDIWCILVGSCLKCRGASAIWFVTHWWHLTSSTLISGRVARLDPSTSTWCSASDGRYLRRQKANGQLEKTAGSPSHRLAEQGSGGCQRSTAIYAVEIWDREGSWSGTTIHSDYATTTTTMMMMTTMKDIRLVSKTEGKPNFSRHLQAVRNRDWWAFENHRRRV